MVTELIELQIDAPQGNIGLRGNLDTSGQWPTDLTLDWRYTDARLGQLKGSGTITGNVKTALELQHEIDGALHGFRAGSSWGSTRRKKPSRRSSVRAREQ